MALAAHGVRALSFVALGEAMTKEFFERHYGMLSDKVDATEVFGDSIEPGVATLGEIRLKLQRYSRTANIYPESDGSGICITEAQRKAFAS
jgi:hypothetical protein